MAKEATLLMIVLFGFFLQETAAIPSFAAECLREHNKIRAKHGAPPLKWDPTLAAHAQKWAERLKQQGMSLMSVHEKTEEGENIALLPDPNCKDALEIWSDEGYEYEDYGYCTSPPTNPPNFMKHFTQLVWKSTKRVGVGISGKWLVARYMPSGNYYGQYANNVKC